MAYRILVSSPVALGLIGGGTGLDRVGIGDWGLKGLGLGLDKSPLKITNGMTDTNQRFIALSYKYVHCKISVYSSFTQFVFNIDIMD